AYAKSFNEVVRDYFRPGAADATARDRARRNTRTARSNLEASLDRLAAEPGVSPQELERWNTALAASHRFAHAMMALEAAIPQKEEAPPRAEFERFGGDVVRTLDSIATMLRKGRLPKKQFPDLREDHNRLLVTGGPAQARYLFANVEADRITNSLN